MDELKNKNFKRKNNDKDLILTDLLEFIDQEISIIINKLSHKEKDRIEEIRLRMGKPLMVCLNGTDFFIDSSGSLTQEDIESHIVTSTNIINTFRRISNYSIYAFEEEIKQGFITIIGGHRVGVAGKAIYGDKGLETIKNISSLNIRVAREKIGVADRVIPYLLKGNNAIYHTLIVSPPQCGKTTLLRDLIRSISNGIPNYQFKGLKVGVVDERSEIASTYNGHPQKEVGLRTDVLDGCSKYDGIILLIRSMSPVVIATDELGGSRDIKAIHHGLKAGVKFIATVHGESIDDVRTKPNMKEIMEEGIFERIIILDNSKGVGTIRDILEGRHLKSILNKVGKQNDRIENIRKLNDHHIQ